MADVDPWTWTTDNLVEKLCSSRSLFNTTGCDPANYPDPSSLEEQLRIQKITGSIFLTGFDTQTIRYGLGISRLEERRALTSVIWHLQSKSLSYRQHKATTGVNSPSINSNGLNDLPSDLPSDTPTGVTTPGDNSRKRGRAVLVSNMQSCPAQPCTQPQGHNTQTASTVGEWDHLMRWADVDEGAEEDDEDEDEDEDDWMEDPYDFNASTGAEEDAQECENDSHALQTGLPARTNKLNPDQIVDTINHAIAHYTNAWTPGKGEIMMELTVRERHELADRYNPDRLWEKAEAAGKREHLAKLYESQTQYFQQRLDELAEEIWKFPRHNLTEVRDQCRNLEVTVHSLELAKWLASIYNLEPVDDSDEESTELEGAADTFATQALKSQPEVLELRPKASASRPDVSAEIIHLDSPPTTPGLENSHIMPSQVSLISTAGDSRSKSSEVHSMVGIDCEVVAASTVPAQVFGDAPENASIATVSRWEWKDLIETQDRKRIVSKAVYEMSLNNREMIRERLQFLGRVSMLREIPACIVMLTQGNERIPGILPRDLPKIVTFTTLFLCWWLCGNYFQETPSRWNLEELTQCLEVDPLDLTTFCDYLSTAMTTTFSPDAMEHPERPSQAEVITISDDEDDTPHRPLKRRRRSTIIILD